MALRRLALGALVLALAVAGIAPAAHAAEPAFSDRQVEAAFLYNFAKFIEWPPSGDDQPILVGVLGDDAFADVLDDTLEGKTVRGRSLRVERLRRKEDVEHCQIVFVGSAEAARFSEILARLRETPTLTVGESADFVEDGGMIGFVVADRRVRFDIDFLALRKARLKPSSQLLKVARRVLGASQETER